MIQTQTITNDDRRAAMIVRANWTFTLSVICDMISRCNSAGGFSYNVKTGFADNQRGYFVSMQGYEVQIPFNISGRELINQISRYVSGKSDELIDSKRVFIGGWVAPDSMGLNVECLYLDLSVKFSNERAARTFARRNNQQAYYDAANGKSIHL